MLILFLNQRSTEFFSIFRQQMEEKEVPIYFLDDEFEQFCTQITRSWNNLAEVYRMTPEEVKLKLESVGRNLSINAAMQLSANERCFKLQMTVNVSKDDGFTVERVEPIISVLTTVLTKFNWLFSFEC